MRAYSPSRLSDAELRRSLVSVVAKERTATATVVAHIAEFDARRLYLPEGYPSMREYCVGELHLSEDAAYKRLQAARAARKFPAILGALAEGRLHLSAVCLLAPHLTPENAGKLLAAAAHRSKSQVERLIAEWFPQLDVPVQVLAMAPALPGASQGQLAPGQVETPVRPTVESSAPGRVRARVTPIAPERFHLQVTIDQETQEMLGYAQDLLGHALPSGDLAQVLKQSVRALIEKLERRKFAATHRSCRSGRSSADPRHIPAGVKHAVWRRDGGQCTFLSENGRPCASRRGLEFDHIPEVARGGKATIANLRLRCRAHNQYEAERTLGVEFMRQKREEARAAQAQAAEARRQEAEVHAAEQARRKEAEVRARAASEELITPLRLLGFTAQEARQAAASCDPKASLEERVRGALSCFGSRPRAASPS